ncbi:MAG TPA: aminoglycoside phosphotransferase family protein [Natronosporangium sp.]
MIDRPDLDERALAAAVAAGWGIEVAGLAFLPVGLDGQAWAYRVDTAGGDRYFLKLRRGEFAPAAVRLPAYLRAQGIAQVVAPLDRPAGGPGHRFGEYRLLLYPFHDGAGLWERGLTDRQWIEYGEFLGRLHAVRPSPEIAELLPVETFRSSAGERLRTLGAAAAASDRLADFWQRYAEPLLRLSAEVDELAARVTGAPLVICHADIHPGNLLADGDGPLHVVDWDAPMLAPRERDLMFVYSGDFGDHPVNPDRAALFRQGYGEVEPDPTRLRYYRSERRLDDVAEFMRSILDPAASPASQANDRHWLTRIAEVIAAESASGR